MVGIILINYHDYATRYLTDCVAALRRQSGHVPWRLFIVDNASTVETQQFISQTAPEAQLIVNTGNDGFAKGNNDGITAARAAGCDQIVLLNMDTIPADTWLEQLLAAAAAAPHWGAIQSRLMLPDGTVNSLGNQWHYLGFGFSAGGYQRWQENSAVVQPISYASCGAVLLSVPALDAVGLFDAQLWMYHEDLDLTWRMRSAGWQVYLAPQSVVVHRYEFAKSIAQYYWMERNRGIVLLTHYRLWTLLLISPMWLAMELGLFVFACRGGWLPQKLRVAVWFCNPGHWPYLWRKRRAIQHARQVSDRALVPYWCSTIQFQPVDNWLLQYVGNPLLAAYWAVIHHLMV